MVCYCILVCELAFSAALPDFTLTVTPTDETCFGNGQLTFSVSGHDPLATITYTIYHYPDLINAIAVQTNTVLSGQISGNYRVIAQQSLNGEFNTQTQEVTIHSAIAPFNYTVSGTHAVCGNDGSLSIQVTLGVAVQYEIISGPIIRPLQTSPVFNNLPAGVYEIRVFNTCGDGLVVTFTLQSAPPDFDIGATDFATQLPTCDRIVVTNFLTPPTNVALTYPITVEYVVFPPNNGTTTTFTVNYQTGPANSLELTTEIPFFYDQSYSYTMHITDGCGNLYTSSNPVNKKMEVLLLPNNAACGHYFLSVIPDTYKPPFLIEFLDYPAGFDPQAFNANHPGPFYNGEVNYGDFTTPVPFGYYSIRITDACTGRSATDDVELIEDDTDPATSIDPHPGCLSNFSLVGITLNGIELASAFVMVAPNAYLQPLPADVSAFITPEDGLELDLLPEGHYLIHLVDVCGNEYDVEFDVPGLTTNPVVNLRADCDLGKGAIRMRVNSAKFLSVSITVAPTGFVQSLPYDASAYITTDGLFSMTDLIPGNYTFVAANNCGLTNIVSQNIPGHAVTKNDFTLIPHCGAFDLKFHHVANTDVAQVFWLQRFNPLTNSWGHPDTNVAYTEGALPNNTNAIAIVNNTTTLNLFFTGNFRILKTFETFGDGRMNQEFKNCIETIREFEFTGAFQITGFEKLTCNGALSDVKVLANGVPPMIYKITHKNGQPFDVDNGTNNVFTNLEPAIYAFSVKQACNDIAIGVSDVAQLPSLAHAAQPNDLVACDDATADGVAEFILSSQTATILDGQSAADYTVTYHISLADAESGDHPLAGNFTTGSRTIYVRVKYNNNADCYALTSFDTVVNPYPVLQMAATWGICPGTNTTIVADGGFDSYLWSTGATTSSITVSQPGTYTLEVTDNYATGNCSGIFSVDVVPAVLPTIDRVETSDWTTDNNTIKVILNENDNGQFLYSIDNVTFQASNTFSGLLPGQYTVYVQSVFGCDTTTFEVYLLNYIKYFTPNGDGIHDYWKVKFSETEPHLLTYIFDRYGKLITGFGSDSPGWDGTLNGRPLPSTDYWFVVVRENGKLFRGHFTLKR